ncbi:MAG: hypothetical protein JWN02_1908 [Acidobacteria bacterium]|nr:hypothetical protein [Acidobacteriota bacterium]
MPRSSSSRPPLTPKVQRLAIGCAILFLVPFIVAGISVTVLGARQFQEGAPPISWLPLVGFGLVFTTIPLFSMSVVGKALRDVRVAQTAQASSPSEPWRWRQEWADGVMVDRQGQPVIVLWILTVFWNAICFPVILFIPFKLDAENAPMLIAALFPLVGIALLCAAIYQTVRRRKFGLSRLTLDRIPIVPGQEFHGDLDAHVTEQPIEGYHFKLTCLRRIDGGRAVREEILWKEEQTVGSFLVQPSATGTHISFAFTLPADALSSDDSIAGVPIIWRLHVRAEVPGVDYAAEFELPVFRRH